MTRRRLCSVFFLAVVALRLPVLLAHLDTWFPFEVWSGNIALAILDGLDADWARSPIMPHIRGGVLFGGLLVPLYAVVGPSAVAMKLLPLLWHAATVALAVALFDRFFNRRTAVAGGLLLLLAPPLLAKLSVFGLASHMESTLPMLAALWAFLAMAVERRPERRYPLLLGLALGFAGFFHLQALLPCLMVLGLWVLACPRRLLSTDLLLLLLGAGLGAAPSWLFEGGNIAYLEWSLVDRAGAGVEPGAATGAATLQQVGGAQGALYKLRHLATGGLVEIMDFADLGARWASVLGWITVSLLTAAAGLAAYDLRGSVGAVFRRLALFRDEAIPAALPLLIYPLVFVATFTQARAKVNVEGYGAGLGNRRMVPLVFALLVLAAVAIGGGTTSGSARRRRLFLLVPLCLAGVVGWYGSLRPGVPWPPQQRGECSEWFTDHISHHAEGNDMRALEALDRIDRGDARFENLRFRIPAPGLQAAATDRFTRETVIRSKQTPRQAIHRATAFGRWLARPPVDIDVAGLRQRVAPLTQEHRIALLHGIGLGYPQPRAMGRPDQTRRGIQGIRSLLAKLGAPDAAPVAEGFGFVVGMGYQPYSQPIGRQITTYGEELPATATPAFFRGVGWGYRQRFLAAPTNEVDVPLLTWVPDDRRQDFLDGYLARRLPAEANVLPPGP